MNRWQFSLRSLFIAMTLVAAVVALVANYPLIAAMCLIVIVPFLMGRTVPFLLTHVPRTARWIYVMFGILSLFAGGYAAVRAHQHHELNEWAPWIVIAYLCGMGLFLCCVAWILPGKSLQKANPTADELTP